MVIRLLVFLDSSNAIFPITKSSFNLYDIPTTNNMKSHTDRTVEQLILVLDIVTEILKFLDKPRNLQRLDQDALAAESSSAVLQSDRCDREQHPLPRRSGETGSQGTTGVGKISPYNQKVALERQRADRDEKARP